MKKRCRNVLRSWSLYFRENAIFWKILFFRRWWHQHFVLPALFTPSSRGFQSQRRRCSRGLLHGTSIYGRDQGKLTWRGRVDFIAPPTRATPMQGHSHPEPFLSLPSFYPGLICCAPCWYLSCVSVISLWDPWEGLTCVFIITHLPPWEVKLCSVYLCVLSGQHGVWCRASEYQCMSNKWCPYLLWTRLGQVNAAKLLNSKIISWSSNTVPVTGSWVPGKAGQGHRQEERMGFHPTSSTSWLCDLGEMASPSLNGDYKVQFASEGCPKNWCWFCKVQDMMPGTGQGSVNGSWFYCCCSVFVVAAIFQ